MTFFVPPVPPAPPSIARRAPERAGGSVSIALTSARVSDAAVLLCRVTGCGSFVVSPALLERSRRVSFALDGSAPVVWHLGVRALAVAGARADCADGLCRFVVSPAPIGGVPPAFYRYRPAYRSVRFLAGVLGSLVHGWSWAGGASSASGVSQVASGVSGQTVGGPASGRAAVQVGDPGALVGVGPASSLAMVREVVPLLDRPGRSVLVRAVVLEVSRSAAHSSAISAVVSALGQVATIGEAAASVSALGVATLNLHVGSFQAVLSALDSTSGARVVTAPVLVTESGAVASFAVGDSVPTVGSVSYTGGSSTPVQSVQYQQSGVVFSVVPTVVGSSIDLAVYQSVSSFVPTQSGVVNSPTLQNRSVSDQLRLRPGQVALLGGLVQRSKSRGSTGWWFLPRLVASHQSSRSSLVVLLAASLVPSGGGAGR